MAILTVIKHQFLDDSGNPLSGGKVYFYETGTSTPKDTYTTSAGDVANSNPIILNSRGEATSNGSTPTQIFMNGLYKVDLKTSADMQVTGYPVDNIGTGNSNNDSTLRWAGTSTGSANTQVLAPTISVSAYAIGQSFVFKAGYTNSGATTISVSGLSAIAVQNNFAACTGGEIIVGRLYQIVLDTLTTAQITIGNAGSASQAFATATLTASGALVTTGNTGVASGSVSYSNTAGLYLWTKAGSSFDLDIVNPANTLHLMTVPTGTQNVNFYGAVSGASYSGGAVSGTTGTFTGAVSGTTISGSASGMPKFRAGRTSSAQSLTSGVGEYVQFNTADYDTGGNFNTTTTWRFTAPISGIYLLTWSIGVGANAGTLTAWNTSLYKQDSVVKDGTVKDSATGATVGTSVGSCIEYMAAGYYANIVVSATGTSPYVSTGTPTHFSGTLLV